MVMLHNELAVVILFVWRQGDEVNISTTLLRQLWQTKRRRGVKLVILPNHWLAITLTVVVIGMNVTDNSSTNQSSPNKGSPLSNTSGSSLALPQAYGGLKALLPHICQHPGI